MPKVISTQTDHFLKVSRDSKSELIHIVINFLGCSLANVPSETNVPSQRIFSEMVCFSDKIQLGLKRWHL